MRRLVATIIVVGNAISAAIIVLVFVLIEPAAGGKAFRAYQPTFPSPMSPLEFVILFAAFPLLFILFQDSSRWWKPWLGVIYVIVMIGVLGEHIH